jgi:hypothetical protein
VLETTLAVPPAPAEKAVAVPVLTPQEFLFSTLLDGPQPATAVECRARERWSPKVPFKARQALRVKATAASGRAGTGLGHCRKMRLTKRFIFIRASGAALSSVTKRG